MTLQQAVAAILLAVMFFAGAYVLALCGRRGE